MEKSNDSIGLSAEDLKSQLFQSMHSAGVLRNLKSQLRQSMINELRGKHGKQHYIKGQQSHPSDLLAATIKQKKSRSWIHQAIDNLVYLHLKQNGYQYSLSLFQQESTIDSYNPSLTNDVLDRLGLKRADIEITTESPGSSTSEDFPLCSSTPDKSSKAQGSILWKILDKLSSIAVRKTFEEKENIELAPKTDEQSLTLGEKLRAIDEEMKLKSSHRPRDSVVAISSYTSAVRRAEEDADRRAKNSFEQWKALELTKLKMEESKKTKAMVDLRVTELERDYQMKRDMLQNREKAAVERMNNHRESLEKEMHDQRQSLLREIDQFRMREDTLHQQEQLMHEIETTKLRELEILRSQTRQVPVKREETSRVGSLRKSEDHHKGETQKMLQEMDEKSKQMEVLKHEVATLKAELSCANLQHHNQAERENLILKSHLDQLTREIQGLKATKQVTVTDQPSEVEVKLRDKVEKLEKEQLDKDAEQRHLMDTMKQMQLALEDSNKALQCLSQSNHKTSSMNNNDPVSLQHVKFNLSPQRQQSDDLLREYEPVQSGSNRLHPALMSSGEFDDPSMDSRVASAGISLDIQHRLKNLETEKDVLDEQYKRYLHVHYRNLNEGGSKKTSGKGVADYLRRNMSPMPLHQSAYQQSFSPKSPVPDLPEFSSLTKDVGFISKPPVLGQESKPWIVETASLHEYPSQSQQHHQPSPRHSEGLSSTSSSDLTDNPFPIAKQVVTQTELPKEPHENLHLNAPEEVASDAEDLKLPMAGLEQDSDSPLSSKTSSENTPSPKVDTVRRVESSQIHDQEPLSNEFKKSLSSVNTLPPIAARRKLPSLPPIKNDANLSIPDPGPSNIHDEKEPPLVPSISDSAGREPHRSDRDHTESDESGHHIGSNPDSVCGDNVKVDDILPEDDQKVVTFHTQADKETAVPIKNVDFTQPHQEDMNELIGSISTVSEEELSSFSDKSDNKPLLHLNGSEVNEKIKDESSSLSSSHSPQLKPAEKTVEVDLGASYSSQFTSSNTDVSISAKLSDKPPLKKSLSDFNLSDDEDISAALRWEDENRPRLDYDDEEIPVPSGLPEAMKSNVSEDSYKDEVDVFEQSDPPLSLDSSVSGKENLKEVNSDDSW